MVNNVLSIILSVWLLTGPIVYWRHVDIMAAAALNHSPGQTRQLALRYSDGAIGVTFTVGIRQTVHL